MKFAKAKTESQNDRSLGRIPITHLTPGSQFVSVCSPPGTSISYLPKAGIHLTAALADGPVSELIPESGRFSWPQRKCSSYPHSQPCRKVRLPRRFKGSPCSALKGETVPDANLSLGSCSDPEGWQGSCPELGNQGRRTLASPMLQLILWGTAQDGTYPQETGMPSKPQVPLAAEAWLLGPKGRRERS